MWKTRGQTQQERPELVCSDAQRRYHRDPPETSLCGTRKASDLTPSLALFYTDFFARGREAAAEEPKPPEMKRTFQPNTRKRRRTHGFLVRMRSKGGRLVLKRRRQKGRSRIGAD